MTEAVFGRAVVSATALTDYRIVGYSAQGIATCFGYELLTILKSISENRLKTASLFRLGLAFVLQQAGKTDPKD